MGQKKRAGRNEFSDKTKNTLREYAYSTCSNPACNIVTTAAAITRDVLRIGEAAHIHAAKPGQARFVGSMTPARRRHIDNAIWLCVLCHRRIDRDEFRYSAQLLKNWKRDHEAGGAAVLGKPRRGHVVTVEALDRWYLELERTTQALESCHQGGRIADRSWIDWTLPVWKAWRRKFGGAFEDQPWWPDVIELYQRLAQVKSALPPRGISSVGSPRVQVNAILRRAQKAESAQDIVYRAKLCARDVRDFIRVAVLSGPPHFARVDTHAGETRTVVLKPDTFLNGPLVLRTLSAHTAIVVTDGHPANREDDSPRLTSLYGPWRGHLELQPEWYVVTAEGSEPATVTFSEWAN